MRIIKKLITILMVGILLFSASGIFQSRVKAATYLINQAELYSKGEMVSFRYKGMGVGVEFVVYKKDGIEYPAYCLNRNLIGVAGNGKAKVTVNKALENAAVWRAVTNGYPFKTAAQLKCNSNAEAFAATKMAVYDALYTYDWSDFEPINEQGKRVIAAAESISKKARSSKETKISGKVEIKAVNEFWKDDEIAEGYISKTYKVNTNVESTEYTIKLTGLDINGAKLTDEKNREKTKFRNGEVFKILIPVTELENKKNESQKFSITATANLRTKPVLYGETADSNFQNYALAGGEWEFEKGSLTDRYSMNKTKIKIVKKDTETKEPLANAKFNILDKNGNVIYADIITNQEGVAEINGVIPGTYYIEEIESPEGYTKYEEQIKIELKFGETYTVHVNNYQKPEEEEKDVEIENETIVTGKKEIALPRTGF